MRRRQRARCDGSHRSRSRIGTACDKLTSTVRAACKAAAAERHVVGPRHAVAQDVAAVVRDNRVPKSRDGKPPLPRDSLPHDRAARRPPSSR